MKRKIALSVGTAVLAGLLVLAAVALADSIKCTGGACNGTNGNDTIDRFGDTGPGTIVGLGGDDSIFTGTGAVSGVAVLVAV